MAGYGWLLVNTGWLRVIPVFSTNRLYCPSLAEISYHVKDCYHTYDHRVSNSYAAYWIKNLLTIFEKKAFSSFQGRLLLQIKSARVMLKISH